MLSLQWGAWIGGGMATNDTSTIGRMERAGVGVVTPELGLAVLGGALSSLLRASAPAGAVLTVSPFDWTRFLAQQPAYADAAFFADVRAAEEGVAPLAETKSQEVAGTRRRRGAQPHAASEQHVQQQLSEAIRGVLGSDVSADEPLMAAGLDSLGAVELRNAVETRMGLQLPGTLVFDYPTVSAMASYVTSRLAPDDEELAADDDIASVADSSLTSDGVMACVTSSAGCTPGEHVESGRRSDGIAGIPLDRWDAEAEALRTGDDASLVRRFGGFMRNVDMFDASCFGVSSAEAVLMDPQQRILLTLHASSSSEGAQTQQRCVAVGISSAEYARLATTHMSGGVTPYSATGASGSVACGRLSYIFDYTGFSISVDTACSSALTASVFAVPYARTSDKHAATLLGISLHLMPVTTKMFAVAGMLAPDGRCKTLDGGADGYVRGEAGGAVQISGLSIGEGGGCSGGMGAVLRGCAVNQDGRSSALTAPNGPAQQDAIRAAMRDARVRDASTVTGLQMHGTGTPLGDPIEVGAATAVLTSKPGGVAIALSASKTFIGHTEPAAGIVGVMAAASTLAVPHAPAILHLRDMNPHVRVVLSMGGACACLAPRASSASPAAHTTGVSSFAFQGTNAHALVGLRDDVDRAAVGTTRRLRGVYHADRRWVTLTSHPMLAYGVVDDVAMIEMRSRGVAAYLHDHRVRGQGIFPGAGYFETASAAAVVLVGAHGEACCAALADVSIPAPLVLDGSAVDVTCALRVASGHVDVRSRTRGVSHLRGIVTRMTASSTSTADDAASSRSFEHTSTSSMRARCTTASSTHELYSTMHGIGLMYGPAFQMLQAVRTRAASRRGIDEATGVVCQPARTRVTGLLIHPATLDAAMQLGNALESPDEDAAVARVPAAVSLYTTTPRATSDARLQVWARLHASTADVTCSFGLRTDAGATLMHMSELVAKPMTKGATTSTKIAVHSTRDAMYAIRWLAQTADATTAAPRALATTTIRVDGASSARAWISSSVYAALSVVQTLSLLDNSEQSVAVHLQTACAVASVAAMTRTSSSSRDGAAIRGLWRTAAQELRHPALTGGTDADEFALHLPHSRNIVDADAQGHAYRGGYWMRAGVRRCTAATPEHAVQLRPQPRGAIKDLIAVVEAAGDDASSTMMRVRVSAVGINFRDVLNVLGMYPGDPGPPGGDCAGTVARACARTAALGESVFGLAAGCLGNYVHAYGDTFAALPAHLRHEAAASMPTVFVTVDLALSQAARTRGGERVLVHAAAGGVGVAATQLAGALDATVYATAGSSAKRYWVRSHAPAVRHVGSSRATTFPDVASMTLGAVDVVLNSLTSAGVVAATVSCMSSRARFVEIGKRDIWTAATLGAERSDATLRLVAVDFLPQAAMRKGMHRVATCASTMQYRPLSTTAHTLVRSHAALRQMSQARHVGKIVVCSPRAVRDDVLAGGVGDGVLVCGGLGSLGALTASWLASMSTCHLHLLGRSGRRGEGLEALVASASLVRMQRCDAATAGDRAVVTAANGPNAVVHAGGVLADATLAQQRASGVRRVFAAKVDSLGTLVQATHANAVSAQVLFSSLAAFLGSPGQSNYCAANAALDAAAHADVREAPRVQLFGQRE